MPVQFICHQCQQLLSVSTRKAGTDVNCPKCRAAVRVPMPDAAAAQLAMRKATRPETAAPPVAEFSELVIYDDVQEFIASPPIVKTASPPSTAPAVEVPFDRDLLSISRRMVYAHAALLLVLTLLGFAMGFAIGRMRPIANETHVDLAPVPIDGQVTYMSDAGGITPDVGAAVIAFPLDGMPDQNAKFGVAGLRPDEPPPAPDSETLQAIESINGVYLRSGDEGRFHFNAKPGKYQVLIISAHVHRPAGAQPQGRDLATLGNYFLPAPELLGNLQYRLQLLDLPRQAPIEQRFGRDGR